MCVRVCACELLVSAMSVCVYELLVGAVQLHHLLLQLFGLPRGEPQLFGVVVAVELGVILSQLRQQGVGAQQRQGDERAGQPSAPDVLTQLQDQEVPARVKGQRSGARESAPVTAAGCGVCVGVAGRLTDIMTLPGEVLRQVSWIRRVELHIEGEFTGAA